MLKSSNFNLSSSIQISVTTKYSEKNVGFMGKKSVIGKRPDPLYASNYLVIKPYIIVLTGNSKVWILLYTEEAVKRFLTNLS